jgi:xanthine dehydrogenase accessory factor
VRDVLDDLLRRWTAGEPAALVTVTATWSSAPRPPGAAMVVGADGTVAGSVSGGCVEAAVYEAATEVLASGGTRTLRYGVSDDRAYEAGLPCGGTVELFVQRVDRTTMPDLPELAAAVAAGRPAALLTCVDGPPDRIGRHRVISGSLHADDPAVDGALAAGRTALLPLADGVTVLVRVFLPPARMIVCGATDHAAAVARIGVFLGYRVTVCDARPVFATAARFPDADEVVVDWPHRYLAAEAAAGRLGGRDAVCVLTHDPRFDVPALRVALGLPVEYVGAMGSRRTHDDRLRRLREAGVDGTALARLSSPIGLDLGACTPEETAVSVAAEIVALRRCGTGARLSTTDGPVHRVIP